jgi:hypothetical protein
MVTAIFNNRRIGHMVKRLVIRNDDIGFLTNVAFLEVFLEELNFCNQTLSIIPFTMIGERKRCVTENIPLLEKIRDSKLELAIHGVFHESKCDNGSYEFDSVENLAFLAEQLKDICSNSMITSSIFIPPHNALHKKWYPILFNIGFNIFSGTKRDIREYREKEISLQCPDLAITGVIKTSDYFLVPQSVMIKRGLFYEKPRYFSTLLEKSIEYVENVDVLVLTIHWWDFLSKGRVDLNYLYAFKNFLLDLVSHGLVPGTFKDSTQSQVHAIMPCDYFAF